MDAREGVNGATAATGTPPLLASGGADGTVRLWDLAAGRASRAMVVPADGSDYGAAAAVTAVKLGSLGDAANWVYAAGGAQLYGFDLRAPGMLLREPARRLTSSRDDIGQLAWHEESGALAAADDAGEIRVHATAAADADAGGSLLATLAGGHTSLCGSVAFRPGRAWEVYSAGLDAVCVRWDWRRAQRIATWPLASARPAGGAAGPEQLLNPRHAHCLSFAPDGGTFALALGDGSVEVREAESGEPVAAVDAHRAAASQAHFMPRLLHASALQRELADVAADEAMPSGGRPAVLPLLSTGDDRQLRLWSVEGVAGRGAATSAAPGGGGGGGGGKRLKAAAEQGALAASGEAEGMDEDDEDEESWWDAEPGFRAMASTALPEKANWLTAVTAAAGRAAVCVATTGEAIEVFGI